MRKINVWFSLLLSSISFFGYAKPIKKATSSLLESRVMHVRERMADDLKVNEAKDIGFDFKSYTLDEQWGNWGNWGNWNNWNNWVKWNDWNNWQKWNDFSNWQKFSNY